ncbi:alpha/beta fold hydrolase [Granulosicoccus sp. 3-233]|uniref:alpha/beta fold hydrolase n=1 Tax=Granulosicoccus sp. 3-233 TaxID=3417969 RepID=UPI003D34090B
MPRHHADGLGIHYELHASSSDASVSTVLLLHGLGSSLRDWSDQVPALTANHQLLLIDLRGHGDSDKPTQPYSIRDMANDVASLINSLKLTGVHAVGLSMGAQIALQLALDHPDLVATITAVNSPADMKPRRLRDRFTVMQRKLLVRLLGMRRLGRIIAERLLPGDEFIDRRRLFADRWSENDPAAYQAALDAILSWDITPELSRIEQAILVICASEDYTPRAWKQRIVELAPNARMVIIPDSRHAVPVERPAAFNAVLLDFLQEQQESSDRSVSRDLHRQR